MADVSLNFRPLTSLDSTQSEALTDARALESSDGDSPSPLSEEDMLSLNVWGDGPKLLLNGDSKPVANFDSQGSAASIFALAVGAR